MPFYYADRQPSWKGASQTMNASVILDQTDNISFTNLDQLSGKVVLRTTKSVDIDSIVVKLEGECRTRLLSPVGPNGEKPKPQLEYHKILYRVQMVFPSAEVVRNRLNYGVGKNASTLGPGTYEYPFSFKLPFNNACGEMAATTPTVSLTGSGLEIAKPPTEHVKKTLPPTLSGFPGEAEIRYFVKATIARHLFFKENPRVFASFNFFPIEPPRPALSGSEVYARQRHTFGQSPDGDASKSKMKTLFSKAKEGSFSNTDGNALQVSVDARLPEPGILTCNEDIPLRLLVKKLNDCDGMVFLQSLEISLIASTKIRAHNVYRTERNSWVIMSRSNMGIPIGAASDPAETETVIDNRMWKGQALPNTVAPSFQTCNIERSYQLDVRVGLSYNGAMQSGAKPQNVALPLRLDIQVYSGIAPPRELLDAMAEAKASIRRRSTVDKTNSVPEKLHTDIAHHHDSGSNIPPTPMEYTNANGAPEIPAQQGSTMAPPPQYFDAPPSYEDAVAPRLAAVNTRRPDYNPPPAVEDELLKGDGDKKKGFMKGK